jgi:hypothetical protein
VELATTRLSLELAKVGIPSRFCLPLKIISYALFAQYKIISYAV